MKSCKYILFLIAVAISQFTYGQTPRVNEFQGKFGVFIAVALVVLVGIFVLLVMLDRKTKRLENRLNELKDK
ncbi:CcmD family protein [Luteibaculum oceani]|uniref:CcmD family protein n=1 Tax=Luteibaculum oceani TaxID=1294296 RepID=A0A5C6UUW1_9FLAO|nr:hypothetical protein [Luteibaculum oceani]TXC77057.1 hypothetical protein FRX97_09330 [Luteibaculum oceani]